MYDGIEAVTHTHLSMALDAALLRQQVIANNIANANTEGFVPQRLNFATYVQEMTRQQAERFSGSSGREAGLDGAAFDARVAIEPAVSSNGVAARVQLDSEVAQMAQNAVQYQALLRGLSHEMGMLSLAVADGKR